MNEKLRENCDDKAVERTVNAIEKKHSSIGEQEKKVADAYTEFKAMCRKEKRPRDFFYTYWKPLNMAVGGLGGVFIFFKGNQVLEWFARAQEKVRKDEE